jgi:MYXO-CTERM domain-containing protein
MHSKIKTLAATAAVAAVTGISAASGIDINGGTSWNGWNSAGNALTDGIWAGGSTTNNYEIYTTSFVFDSATHGVSGTPLGNSSFSGTGFADGSIIVGIGIRLIDPSSSYTLIGNPDGSGGASPFTKWDVAGDSYEAAASVGGLGAKTSGSGFADDGDFNFQSNGVQNATQAYQPNFFTRYNGDGSNVGTQLNGTDGPVRSFFSADGSGFQTFVDFTELQNAPWNRADFGGDDMKVVLDFGAGFADSVVSVAVVPVPPAAAMGLLGLAGVAARRRFSRG